MAQPEILAFGELLWDLLPSGAVLGGAPANFAFRMNALGTAAALVSRLGRDALGKSAFEQLTALGMDTRHIQWDDELPTGTVPVRLDERGNPDFTIVQNTAYDRIECTGALLDLARQVRGICFGTLVQRAERSRRTLQTLLANAPDALKLLDLNLRKECYTAETISESLEHASVLKLNEAEMRHLAELFQLPANSLHDFAQAAMRKWRLSHCLVTLGEWGAFAASAEGEAAYSPGYQVELADTCGSGDAFSAGFLHSLLQGRSTASCLEAGNALGAIVATQRGATQPISSADLETFQNRGIPRRALPGLSSVA